jgi:hypothetical protein
MRGRPSACPAKGVIDERRGVLSGIGNAGEIVFQIVSVCGDVLRRLGHTGETVGHRSAAAARVTGEADEGVVSILYFHPLLPKGVGWWNGKQKQQQTFH